MRGRGAWERRGPPAGGGGGAGGSEAAAPGADPASPATSRAPKRVAEATNGASGTAIIDDSETHTDDMKRGRTPRPPSRVELEEAAAAREADLAAQREREEELRQAEDTRREK